MVNCIITIRNKHIEPLNKTILEFLHVFILRNFFFLRHLLESQSETRSLHACSAPYATVQWTEYSGYRLTANVFRLKFKISSGRNVRNTRHLAWNTFIHGFVVLKRPTMRAYVVTQDGYLAADELKRNNSMFVIVQSSSREPYCSLVFFFFFIVVDLEPRTNLPIRK